MCTCLSFNAVFHYSGGKGEFQLCKMKCSAETKQSCLVLVGGMYKVGMGCAVQAHAQLLIQVGNLERQCGLAGRTPDGEAWDLLSIPSCITVRDLAKHFSLCLSSSVKVLTSPSLTFLHRLPRKAAQKAARGSQKCINKCRGV